MEIKFVRTAMLDNSGMARVIGECRAYLTKARFTGGNIDIFCENVSEALRDYAEHFGEETEVKYSVRRGFNRIDFQMSIPGESYDPFEEGSGAGKRTSGRRSSR